MLIKPIMMVMVWEMHAMTMMTMMVLQTQWIATHWMQL